MILPGGQLNATQPFAPSVSPPSGVGERIGGGKKKKDLWVKIKTAR